MEIEAESTNNKDLILNKVIPFDTHAVIDGGALLRQLFWSGAAFKEVINENRRYALSNSIRRMQTKNSQGSLRCKTWSIQPAVCSCFSWRKCKCLLLIYLMMILKTVTICSKKLFFRFLIIHNYILFPHYRNFITSKMELVMRIVQGWKPFNIVLKSYILNGTKFWSLSLGYVTMQ